MKAPTIKTFAELSRLSARLVSLSLQITTENGKKYSYEEKLLCKIYFQTRDFISEWMLQVPAGCIDVRLVKIIVC